MFERTRSRLQAGELLSGITADFADRFGINHPIVPATDEPMPTVVNTPDGDLSFQDYFVRLQCVTDGYRVRIPRRSSGQTVIRHFERHSKADRLMRSLSAPSNPYVSIAPILAVPAISDFIYNSGTPVIVVSPIVGGQAIKGPAAKMMKELGAPPSALSIAHHLSGHREHTIVIDTTDSDFTAPIQELGLEVLVTNTIMNTAEEKTRLADDILTLARHA